MPTVADTPEIEHAERLAEQPHDPTPRPRGERVDRVAETMQRTTAAIVDAIERGAADPAEWCAPWHRADPDAMIPRNAATGAEYQGGNRLNLYMLAATTGAAPYWATFNQWRDLAHPVPKGCSAGAYVLRPLTKKIEHDDGTDPTYRTVGMRAHAVWSADQVGWETPAPAAPRPVPTDRDDIDAAYRWAATIGVRVEESPHAGASYSPQLDRVQMPDRDRFTDGHGAWSTMAHECTHWTGHESRLARTFGRKFGDDAYAAEELCAELGAAFTLAARGRSTEPRPDHAHYLASWLRVLRARPDALWTVASRAETAARYLTERALDLASVAA